MTQQSQHSHPPVALSGYHPTPADRADALARLTRPLPLEAYRARQDGKVTERPGQNGAKRYVARYVLYTPAEAIRTRLDESFPLAWDLEVTPVAREFAGETNSEGSPVVVMRATLTIHIGALAIARADIGQGRDAKASSTDAFKRAAARFGIGHELQTIPGMWVDVDGPGKYPKPVQPLDALLRAHVERYAPKETAAPVDLAAERQRREEQVKVLAQHQCWTPTERARFTRFLAGQPTLAALGEMVVAAEQKIEQRTQDKIRDIAQAPRAAAAGGSR